MSCPLCKPYTNGRISLDVQSLGCAEPVLPMCQVKVTVKGQLLNKQIIDIMFRLLCKSYTDGKKSLILAQLPMCQFKVKVAIEGQLSAQGQGHN